MCVQANHCLEWQLNIFPVYFFRPNFPMILVANEPLLEEEGERGKRVVSTTEGEAMALRLKVQYRFNVRSPQTFC